MFRFIVCGCNGYMGRVITDYVASRLDCTIVAGIDMQNVMLADFPVFQSPSEYTGEADVIIDFSHPSALSGILEYAVARRIPAVIATTGLSKQHETEIQEASKFIPVFFSGNMTLGINLLIELAKKATLVLGSDFDVEIIEKHHNQKIDAPSGTALMIADAVAGVMPESPHYTYDRHSMRKKRDKSEIGIHAIRGGTIVGEHEVLFAGRDELITLTHSASSKKVFATGSVNAAIFLIDKQPGLYNMGHLVDSK